MTLDEAKRVYAAYQCEKAKGTPAEYMRYMEAKSVMADHNLLALTPAQRGFLAAARRPATTEGAE